MSRVSRATRLALSRHFPYTAAYEGSGGTVWFVGFEQAAQSIAAYFCSDDVSAGPRRRVWSHRVPGRIMDVAEAGGLPILSLAEPGQPLADIVRRAVAVPTLVDIHTRLPSDTDTLRAQLLTSTTREDFRRIRKANFSYRVTSNPDAVREFHARHYAPLVAQRFPEDGRIMSVDKMLRDLDRGGELVCADIDGTWVAGIFNVTHDASYALRSLGIRDADLAVRQKRVVAALIVRSLERSVELGKDRASLGRSLPFLGKGPVWFKAKWGGIVTLGPATSMMHMLLDLRHAAVRRLLSESPIIHTEGDALVVSTWLEPGEKPLQTTVRDAGRFPGITRWYVVGQPETLAAGAEVLSASERAVPVPVTPIGDRPLWLGEVLSGLASSV